MKYVRRMVTTLVLATFSGLIVACDKDTSANDTSFEDTNPSHISVDPEPFTSPELQLSEADRQFLSQAENFGASLWTAWQTLPETTKIEIGQKSCSGSGDGEFVREIIYQYGGNLNPSEAQGASAVVTAGRYVYCYDVAVEGLLKQRASIQRQRVEEWGKLIDSNLIGECVIRKIDQGYSSEAAKEVCEQRLNQSP